MASSKEGAPLERDIRTTCPICFESFKTPRILPCLHTFCHNCLSSFILSTCKTKESPVGFPCPLCRRFVPAPSFSLELEKWSEHIPVKKTFQVLIEKGDKLCDACQREHEDLVASDWCESCSDSLCAVCAKAHKRNTTSRNHTLVPIADFCKVPGGNESLESAPVVCQEHSKRVKYICVDHEELCCTKCVCTKHRKCTQVDDIEEAAENLRKSEKIKKLSKEISQFEGSFTKAKSNGEDTIKYIEDTTDQIKEESTELRDRLVNHVNPLLEDHLSELAQNAKKQKERLASFVDAASDRQFLMAQYLHTLEFSEDTPAPVLIQDYYTIKRHFEHVTRSGFGQVKLKLQSHVPKDLTGILKFTKFTDLKTQMKSVPLRGIDFTSAEMKLICELPDSNGDITGGCFLENGDIILVGRNSSKLLHYSNATLTHSTKFDIKLQDAVCQNTTRLLISKNVLTKKRKSWGFIGTFNLDQFEDNKFYIAKENRYVYGLAISEEFVYAACSEVIIKFDYNGRTVQQYPVDKNTFSVATNNNNEIISSSCDTHKVTVMSSSGEKLYTYSTRYFASQTLRYPQGLDVNFTGNIFVAGKDSRNIHVLTPKAELLKIFAIDSESPPISIKLKENSNVCFVGFCETPTKVYEFQEDAMWN
ncbi:uncharacterized protein LOC128162410 [Crassostrea angulata]|uniref:uncharacterized protein LOC128162410 n=1 Tax=Magallana angulata TaxID=2784310 RepID=UPI0022B11067|nr:uncharacterized protein LOC128162410 [Crassostrea angulata]